MRERGNRHHWVDEANADPFSDGFAMLDDDDSADRCRRRERVDIVSAFQWCDQAKTDLASIEDRRTFSARVCARRVDAEIKKARELPRTYDLTRAEWNLVYRRFFRRRWPIHFNASATA